MSIESLGALVTKLRLELGHSSSAAAGINMRDQLVYILNRVQEELALDYDWPGMSVDRDIPLVVGARYYAYPADVPFDQINKVWTRWSTVATELAYGVGPLEMAIYDSDLGRTSWPVQQWRHNSDDNTLEVWPVPNQAPVATATTPAAMLRVQGSRVPPAMVGDADLCVLPGAVLVMFGAAEIMAREADKGTALKLDKAKEYLRRYKVRQNSHKSRPFVVGGGVYRPGARPGLDYIPMGYGLGP